MFKKFQWFIHDYRKKLSLALFFLLLSDIVALIPPFITGKLTDAVFEQSITLSTFLQVLLLDLFVIAIKYLLAILWSYYTFRGANEMEYLARHRLVEKIFKQAQPFFERHSTGSLMGKATNDVNTLTRFAGFGTLSFFDSCIYPVFIIVVMIVVVDVKLTLFSILPLPILAYLCILIGDKIYEKFALAQKAFDRLNDNVLEDVEGIRMIRVFNLQDMRKKLFEGRGENLCRRNMEVVKYQAMIEPVERIVPALTFMIAVGYGAYCISIGRISVGQLVSFTYYLNMLIWPMYALGNFINLKQQALASMNRIQEVWDYREEVEDVKDAVQLKENPSIDFSQFSFRYPSSTEDVLSDIDLTVTPGKSLGVLGKTGSGKTTLLKQFFRFYPVNEEKMLVSGNRLSHFTLQSLRSHFAYVPQQQMIFSKSVRENIRLGKLTATEEEIWHAVECADLVKDISTFRDGLDTLCGERGISLSGGQKQRISLARAFLKNPDILIVDDGLSAVDAQTESHIINRLIETRKGKTTIIAAHRISQVMHCDEIIVLNRGKIMERGTHETLMEQGGWYYEQFMTQTAKAKWEEKT